MLLLLRSVMAIDVMMAATGDDSLRWRMEVRVRDARALDDLYEVNVQIQIFSRIVYERSLENVMIRMKIICDRWPR